METTIKMLNDDERVREACWQRIMYDFSMRAQYEAGKAEEAKRADAADKRADTEAKRADAAEQELRRLKERLSKYEPVDWLFTQQN